MCGIVALLRRDGRSVDRRVLDDLVAAVAHRGPDGKGTALFRRGQPSWAESTEAEPGCLALGHRRLAILDLSAAAAQPMKVGEDLWLVFNGEIYNFLELRRELAGEGQAFRTDSDSEVILAAYRQWGVECFSRFRGMWGLVLFDASRGRLVLSRDRLGIKPLYVFESAEWFAVVSEIKQLSRLPGLQLKPNDESIGEYLQTGWESTERTFFQDVRALPGGTWAVVDLEAPRLNPQSYWHPESIRASISDPGEAAAAIREVLSESVRFHLRSDVPVGCALSGGLDSSAVAVLANEVRRGVSGAQAFHTFSIRFPGEPIDEGAFIAAVNRRIEACPSEVVPTSEEFLADVDRFVWHQDEPVGSLAMYAGFALARLTRRQGVPVSLNGQGGDEVLGGYWQSYFGFLRSAAARGRFDIPLAHLIAAALPGGNGELWTQIPVMARRFRSRKSPSIRLRIEGLGGPNASDRMAEVLALSPAERRLHEIRELFLPRLLRWDDRNFMAFGVEGRYPFLDHVVIETALKIDSAALYHSGWTKMPIRIGLEDLLPRAVAWRRSKLGFETPQSKWMRGAMFGVLKALVAGDSPAWSWADRESVRSVLLEMEQGAGSEAVFRVLMLDRWLRCFRLESAAP